MKSTVVDESLFTNATRVLFQRKTFSLLPVTFLSHTFTDAHWKWSTTKQETYSIIYAVTKWNYYLQGSDIVVHNDHKPLQKFRNGKNVNNRGNRWSLELTIYNITFEWISGASKEESESLS